MTFQSEWAPTVPHVLLVQHNYHDHSNDVPYRVKFDDYIGDPSAILSNDSYEPQAAAGGRPLFPMKLHELLAKTEEDGLADIVSWKPHGRAFVVRNAKKFAEIILPQYFGKTKFLSFQRQLSLYDFTRISEGPDEGAYYHEMFLRGKIFLADCMTRRRIKGTRIKASANPEKEPNFYTMSYVGGTDITALIAPVDLQPLLESKRISTSIMPHRFDEKDAASFCRYSECIVDACTDSISLSPPLTTTSDQADDILNDWAQDFLLAYVGVELIY